MLKSFIAIVACVPLWITGAIAGTCAGTPYTLTNGTTADANQVMGNFNNLLNCANNNLAPLTSPHFTGNVGIGTSTPLSPLSIAGSNGGSSAGFTASFSSQLGDTGANGNQLNITNSAGSWGLIAGFDGPNASGLAYHTSNSGYIINVVNGPLYLGANNLPTLTIAGSGNVGIGTRTPTVALAVIGDIRAGTSGSNGCVQNFAGTALIGTCSSDARLKTVLGSITNLVNRFTRLDLVHFKWNETAATIYHNSTKPVNTGFTAQSVEKAFPELVSTDSHGYKQVNYTSLQLYGLEAIKELKAENDRQAEEIAALKQAVVALQRQNQTKTATNDKARPMIKRPK